MMSTSGAFGLRLAVQGIMLRACNGVGPFVYPSFGLVPEICISWKGFEKHLRILGVSDVRAQAQGGLCGRLCHSAFTLEES